MHQGRLTKIREYDETFDYFKRGNDLLKKNSKFKIENEKKVFLKIKGFFEKKIIINKLKNLRKIIFIVGMPRSGTSLVEQIISSHHNVYGGGELTFLKDIIEPKILDQLNHKDLENMKNFETLLSDINNEYYNKISLIDNSNKVFTDKSPLNFKYIGFI